MKKLGKMKIKDIGTMRRICKRWSFWYMERYFSKEGVKESERGFG